MSSSSDTWEKGVRSFSNASPCVKSITFHANLSKLLGLIENIVFPRLFDKIYLIPIWPLVIYNKPFVSNGTYRSKTIRYILLISLPASCLRPISTDLWKSLISRGYALLKLWTPRDTTVLEDCRMRIMFVNRWRKMCLQRMYSRRYRKCRRVHMCLIFCNFRVFPRGPRTLQLIRPLSSVISEKKLN